MRWLVSAQVMLFGATGVKCGSFTENCGAAYIGTTTDGGVSWSLQEENGEYSGDLFGTSVAVSGTVVVIGAEPGPKSNFNFRSS